eukprot:1122352-Rhodomonas_salina.2
MALETRDSSAPPRVLPRCVRARPAMTLPALTAMPSPWEAERVADSEAVGRDAEVTVSSVPVRYAYPPSPRASTRIQRAPPLF